MPTPKLLVDLKIKTANGEVDLQKLPADLSIADFGNGMVVSESRDAIYNEIEALRKTSQRVVDSIEYHQTVMSKCTDLMAELNPQVKQEAEFDSLKQEVSGIKGDLAELKGMLAKFLN